MKFDGKTNIKTIFFFKTPRTIPEILVQFCCLRLQSVFTYVAGIYANLWEQKKVT